MPLTALDVKRLVTARLQVPHSGYTIHTTDTGYVARFYGRAFAAGCLDDVRDAIDNHHARQCVNWDGIRRTM